MTGLGATWITVKNNRHTNVLLVGILAQKKVIDRQKHHFSRFWRLTLSGRQKKSVRIL